MVEGSKRYHCNTREPRSGSAKREEPHVIEGDAHGVTKDAEAGEKHKGDFTREKPCYADGTKLKIPKGYELKRYGRWTKRSFMPRPIRSNRVEVRDYNAHAALFAAMSVIYGLDIRQRK